MASTTALLERASGSSVRLILALALFVAGLFFGIAAMRALAAPPGSDTIYACVHIYTGESKIKLPGQPPTCNPNEMLVEWPGTSLAADLAALQMQVDALETQLIALDAQVPACLSDASGDALFSGCNVQIVSGGGATDAAVNGFGNLIVGYNEDDSGFVRTGSHNIVVGRDHGYASYGGLVVGLANQISGEYASVSGGRENVASGNAASVSGGLANTAESVHSSVGGGNINRASAPNASVQGGVANVASGAGSSVSGGGNNQALGLQASVSGGSFNTAFGTDAHVSGGFLNEANQLHASVGGGMSNITTADGQFLP